MFLENVVSFSNSNQLFRKVLGVAGLFFCTWYISLVFMRMNISFVYLLALSAAVLFRWVFFTGG